MDDVDDSLVEIMEHAYLKFFIVLRNPAQLLSNPVIT
jgi:hypothetical protein